jgi:hypothetical protein
MSKSAFFVDGADALSLPSNPSKGLDEQALQDINTMYKKPRAWNHIWNQRRRQQLLDLVHQELETKDSIDWDEVAMKLGSPYSPINCKLFYENGIADDEWTEHDKAALEQLVGKLGENNWTALSTELNNGKSPIDCLSYYQQNINAFIKNREPWTDQERQVLRDQLIRYGVQDMSALRHLFPGRDSQSIHYEYQKAIRSANTVGGRWKEEQERKLFLSAIAYRAYLSSTATDNQDDDHSDSEDESVEAGRPPLKKIKEDVTEDTIDQKMKRNVWHLIARNVTGKDNLLCREKWIRQMDPSIPDSA